MIRSTSEWDEKHSKGHNKIKEQDWLRNMRSKADPCQSHE